MDIGELEVFFERHPKIREEKPGLYQFLADTYWRKLYEVDMDESEHLAEIEITGPGNDDPHVWARELEQHRGQRR